MPGEVMFLFEKGLALVNLIAFATLHWQLTALIGSRGVTPAAAHIAALRRRSSKAWSTWPTLCFLWVSDAALTTYCVLGELCALLVLLVDAWPLSVLALLVCAVLYASLLVVAQPWLGLQMHANLVETDVLYVLLAAFGYHAPALFLWGFRWFIFRKMLSCGLGKLVSHDASWKWPDLSAMGYHYHTMPLPNPLSPYFHALPRVVHQAETVATHVLETFPVPLCALAPWWWPRCLFFVATVGLNVLINLSGNFGHLGLLTMVECLPVLDDADVAAVLPFAVARPVAAWSVSAAVLALLGLVPLGAYVLVSTLALLDVYDERGRFAHLVPAWLRTLQSVYSRCRCLTRHSKFRHMTKFRWEFVIEGSYDGVAWREYTFRFKPSRPDARPPFVPGLLPSLDWQLWFLPLRYARQQSLPEWYAAFLDELLRGNVAVTALLADDPFAREGAPAYVRTLVYKYDYARPLWRCGGAWWHREVVGTIAHSSALATARALEARTRLRELPAHLHARSAPRSAEKEAEEANSDRSPEERESAR